MKNKEYIVLVIAVILIFGFAIPLISKDVDKKAATPKLEKYDSIGISYIDEENHLEAPSSPSEEYQKLIMDYINYNGRDWNKVDIASENYYKGIDRFKITISDDQTFHIPDGFEQDGTLTVYLSNGAENSEEWAVYKTAVKANIAKPLFELLSSYRPVGK